MCQISLYINYKLYCILVDKWILFFLLSLLKSRFKRLRPLVQVDVRQMTQTIAAACVLHNICIQSSDDLTFEDDGNAGVYGDINNNDNNGNPANDIFAAQDRARGNIKRLNIARRLGNGV